MVIESIQKWVVTKQEPCIQVIQVIQVNHDPPVISLEQSSFLQVKIYMKVDLHMVGCRQFAGVRRLA